MRIGRRGESKKALFEKASKELYGGIVEYRPNAELKRLAIGLTQSDGRRAL